MILFRSAGTGLNRARGHTMRAEFRNRALMASGQNNPQQPAYGVRTPH